MRENHSKFGEYPIIEEGLRPFRFIWLLLLLVWLAGGHPAVAQTTDTGSQDLSSDWITSPPPADLSGFFDLGVNPFPDESDPSQPWTSQQNIDIVDYWDSLVAELGDDPSLIDQLNGLGMNDPSTGSSADLSSDNLVLSNSLDASVAPEPETNALLCAGLICLCVFASRRRLPRP